MSASNYLAQRIADMLESAPELGLTAVDAYAKTVYVETSSNRQFKITVKEIKDND